MGAKGLRQGDPMSPYLFVLVMEVFTGIMRKQAQTKEFKWHPQCQKLKLSHLAFADDLLIFSKANKKSIAAIKQALTQFQKLTGLNANLDKSSIFFGGCNEALKQEIRNVLNFNEGN